MILSTSNNGREWSLEIGSDSVTLTGRDIVQNMAISSQEITLAAWRFLLSQRQDFLNNRLALVPINPNQKELWR